MRSDPGDGSALPRSVPLERLARLAATLLDAPVSLVSVLDEERHHIRASTGLPDDIRSAGELPLTHSVCRRVVAGGRPLLLGDTAGSELEEARRSAADLDVRAYAGVPVRDPAGTVLGTVCVGDTRNRTWSQSDEEILTEIAAAAALEMELREDLRSARELDALTGLPNRASCERLVEETQAHAHARGAAVAVLVVDLVRLRLVNDSMGRDAGDRVLLAVGRRLVDDLAGVVVARIGGDQFAIVAEARDERAALELADRVRSVLAAPIRIGDESVFAGHSTGIALGERGDLPSDLIEGACAAVTHAKAAPNEVAPPGGAALRERAAERLRLEVGLRSGIERGEILPHYQPIFDLRDGRLSGFEALARWTSATLGPVSPGAFIPVAEESGLVALIGRLMLRTAMAEAAGWDAPAGVSVNVSPEQLVEGFADQVAGVLADTGLTPQRLTLEVTESALVHVDGAAARALEDLHALGVRLALDDFGTGYSSLSQLAALPLDVLKIDRSFIARLDDDRTRTVVRATLAMAEGLGLLVTAEGIEEAAQATLLTDMGCTHAQGFWLGRPADAQTARGLVAAAPAVASR